MANLVTTLLTDLEKTYIRGHDKIDKKMRKRITTSIDILNNNQEVSNLIIKNDPFQRKHGSGSRSARSARSSRNVDNQEESKESKEAED